MEILEQFEWTQHHRRGLVCTRLWPFEAFLVHLRWIWGWVWLGWRYVPSNRSVGGAFEWMKGVRGLMCTFGLFVVDLRLAIALWCFQLCNQIDIFGVVWINLHLGEGWCALGHVHLGLTCPSVQCPLCSFRIRLRKLLDRDLTEVQQFVVYWGVNKREFCDNPVQLIPFSACMWHWTVQRHFSCDFVCEENVLFSQHLFLVLTCSYHHINLVGCWKRLRTMRGSMGSCKRIIFP